MSENEKLNRKLDNQILESRKRVDNIISNSSLGRWKRALRILETLDKKLIINNLVINGKKLRNTWQVLSHRQNKVIWLAYRKLESEDRELKRLSKVLNMIENNISFDSLNYEKVLVLYSMINMIRAIEDFNYNFHGTEEVPLFSPEFYSDTGDYAKDHRHIFWFEQNMSLIHNLNLEKFFNKLDEIYNEDTEKELVKMLLLVLQFHQNVEERKRTISYLNKIQNSQIIESIVQILKESIPLEYPEEEACYVQKSGSFILSSFLDSGSEFLDFY
ncbi:unnamed protein product, partial [marine sediment metagenome]